MYITLGILGYILIGIVTLGVCVTKTKYNPNRSNLNDYPPAFLVILGWPLAVGYFIPQWWAEKLQKKMCKKTWEEKVES